MENKIKQLILDHSENLFGQAIDESLIQFQKTRKEVEGDLTLVVFPFVKILRCSPVEAGNKLGAFLVENCSDISKFEVINGFLNLSIANDFWKAQLKHITQTKAYGFAPENSKPAVMVEYSSPNTNKPLHLGHLRNNFLGYSVAEILKANGHKVVKTQIINDRGIHICKSMLAWERFSPLNEQGERETPQNTNLKGDKLVGRYYVAFDRENNAEARAILTDWENGNISDYAPKVVAEYQKLQASKEGKDENGVDAVDFLIKDLAKNSTSLMRDAKEMLVKWEARDPQTYLLWTTMNGWVYQGFEKTYARMGVDFDKLYYESDTFLLGKDIVMEGLSKGVFYQKEDKSIWIDLTEDGLDEKLVLRSDGTSVYITQDIGTAVDRFKDYPDLSGIVYTVGNEQDYHFKVLFLILKKMGYAWAENCFHLSYGMVDLPHGKMKSREGTVVDADDLMEEVIRDAEAMTRQRGHLEGMSENEIQQLFEMIGLGGLKYFLLKVDPKKRMKFNPAESIELNGHTAPFIQYTHARIQSLLSKYEGEITLSTDVELNDLEKELVKTLTEFPAAIQDAATNYAPSVIANYIYELVKQYNTYYQSVYILSEEVESIKQMRLALSKAIGEVIKSAMKVLGINVPNKM